LDLPTGRRIFKNAGRHKHCSAKKEPMIESSHAFRKSVSIALIVIGSFMVIAGVFILKEKKSPTALLSGVSLMAIAAALFLRRTADKS
jgi:small-conductance mechanosensitive channel